MNRGGARNPQSAIRNQVVPGEDNLRLVFYFHFSCLRGGESLKSPFVEEEPVGAVHAEWVLRSLSEEGGFLGVPCCLRLSAINRTMLEY